MLAIRRQLILAAASPWNKGIWERLTGKVSSLQEEKLLLCTSTFQASDISLKHPRRERAATCSWKEAASPQKGGELKRNHPGFWEPPQLQRDDKDGFNPSPAPGVWVIARLLWTPSVSNLQVHGAGIRTRRGFVFSRLPFLASRLKKVVAEWFKGYSLKRL